MNISVHWEPADIKPGTVVCASGRSERDMIGYLAEKHSSKSQHFTLNSLSDGMVWKVGTAKEIADSLNGSKYLPYELVKDVMIEWKTTLDERTA